jgi:predicted transcriptional regulator
MRLPEYLESRGESQAAFARRTGIPQSTVNLICNGKGTRVDTAIRIIQATRDEPAPDGGTVRIEDLVGIDDAGAAA